MVPIVSVYEVCVVGEKYLMYTGDAAPALGGVLRLVGRASRSVRRDDLRVTGVPALVRAEIAAGHFPEWENLRFPTRTSTENLYSLVANLAKGSRNRQPPINMVEAAELKASMLFDEPGPTMPSWAAEFRLPTRRELLSKVSQLSTTANAGFPYCRAGLKKRDYAVANFDLVYNLVCERLYRLATFDEDRVLTPERGLLEGLCDPVYPIEKDKAFDASRKTVRLIIMGSVVDELIDRLTTDEHDRFELRNYGRFYSMLGIGFNEAHHAHVLESFEEMEQLFQDGGIPEPALFTNDASFFEYQIRENLMLLEADCVSDRLGANNYLRKIIRMRALATSRAVYVNGDGALYAQVVDGVQKSGQKRTSTRNTNLRRLFHLRAARRVGLPRSLSLTRGAGDDIVEPYHPDLLRAYGEIGLVIKAGSELRCDTRTGVDFCSHIWKHGLSRPEPKNASTSAFHLLCGTPDVQKYSQWLATYWDAPDRRRFVALFDRLGWPTGQVT